MRNGTATHQLLSLARVLTGGAAHPEHRLPPARDPSIILRSRHLYCAIPRGVTCGLRLPAPEGRVRIERSLAVGPNAAAGAPVVIQIKDPVANAGYVLDTENKVAHRVPYSSPEGTRTGGGSGSTITVERLGARAGEAGRISATATGVVGALPSQPGLHPGVTQEDLGSQEIEGVMATGHRTVQTWPAGSQGNDRPFQVIMENWYSADIKETVLSKNSDPRNGRPQPGSSTSSASNRPPICLCRPRITPSWMRRGRSRFNGPEAGSSASVRSPSGRAWRTITARHSTAGGPRLIGPHGSGSQTN